MAELEAQSEQFSTDYQKLMELAEQKAPLQAELDALYEQWTELAE